MIHMKNKYFKHIGALTAMLFIGVSAWAQDAAAGKANDPFFYDRFAAYFFTGIVTVIGIGVFIALFRLLNVVLKMQQIKIYQEQGLQAYLDEIQKPQQPLLYRLYKRWTNVVPVEREQDIMFDHDYDGIRELDNSLPPWWVAMFYLTIAFAGIYLVYYHFTGIGPSSKEEYEMEVKEAKVAVDAFLAKQANLVDENSVVALTDENALNAGKTIFTTTCAACHGALGEGGVGPNMTDKYWIHGGGINNIFKTIKYGVPDKGMISWQSQLRPVDIQNVASYILTLQGTNPPNGKAPQGTLDEGTTTTTEPTAAPADTTATTTTTEK